MATAFREIFLAKGDLEQQRAKYLSKVFGTFSEEIVRIWAKDQRAPYEDLGRPNLRMSGEQRGHQLDFTFRSRASGQIYVSEMKCEIQFQNFKFFVLKSTDQLDHHKKPAFAAFLQSARAPDQFSVKLKGPNPPLAIHGAMLVWGAVDENAKKAVASETGLHDILSVETICQDLVVWRNQEYVEAINKYQMWSNRLFDGLAWAGVKRN